MSVLTCLPGENLTGGDSVPMAVPEITQLLHAWRDGDRSVENDLVALIYPLLRNMSVEQLRRNRASTTLRATELVHEAYERLHRQQGVDWQNRQHFLAIAATVIRRVLVDHLRQRSTTKRGGEAVVLALDSDLAEELPQPAAGLDWVALDQALSELEKIEPNCVKVVEMRVFAGLGVDQVAETLGISTATVGRLWRFARAYLADHLGN